MSRLLIASSLVAVALVSSACDKNPKSNTETTSASQPAATTAVTATPTTETTPRPMAMPMAMPMGPAKAVITFKNVGLATPESVLHDADADAYIVSNIEGKPLEADGQGFISRLTPDGKVETLKWIESGKNNVKLNAPKGLGLMGDMLYVADLDTVRMFDRKTGMPKGEVKVPGATFLNDIAITSDGRVLVSDTGMKAGAKGFEPSGTDAVYAIDKDKKLTTIIKAKDLGGPNGILPTSDKTSDKTWVVTFGSGELFSLDAKGRKGDVQKLPKGQLDGIMMLPSGDLLISSWEGQAVYRGKPGGEFKMVIEDVKSPADIGFDAKRNRLLVPLFELNQVDVFEVK